MSLPVSKPYIDSWSEEFAQGWKEGYMTALDELGHKIGKMIEEVYEEKTL